MDRLAAVPQSVLEQNGGVITPVVYPVITEAAYRPAPGEQPVNFTRLQKHLTKNEARCGQLSSLILANQRTGRMVLVLAGSLELLDKLPSMVTDSGAPATFSSRTTKA